MKDGVGRRFGERTVSLKGGSFTTQYEKHPPDKSISNTVGFKPTKREWMCSHTSEMESAAERNEKSLKTNGQNAQIQTNLNMVLTFVIHTQI